MTDDPTIDFLGPPLSLEDVRSKVRRVVSVLRDGHQKARLLERVLYSLGILSLCGVVGLSAFALSDSPRYPLLFVMLLVQAVACLLAGYTLAERVRERAVRSLSADLQFGICTYTASVDELLRPVVGIDDMRFLQSVVEHDSCKAFSPYVVGVLKQRDMTVFELTQLRIEVDRAIKAHESGASLVDAKKIRDELVAKLA